MSVPIDLQEPPIVVHAERWERDYRESTSTISHYSEEDFKSSGATTVTEFLKNQAGINLFTSGAFGKASSLFLRGTSNRHTLVLIDGVRSTDLTAIGGGSRLEFLGLQGVSKIEILKGSQSVLYGPEAIGGVINITTKKEAGGRTELRYGSFDDKSLHASVGGKKKAWFYRLNANIRDVNGISAFNEKKGITTPDGLETKSFDSYLQYQTKERKLSFQARLDDNQFDYDNFNSDANNQAKYQSLSFSGIYREDSWDFLTPTLQVDYRKIERDIVQRGASANQFVYDGNSLRGELTLSKSKAFGSFNTDFLLGATLEKEATKNLGSLLSKEESRERRGGFFNGRLQYLKSFLELGGRYENFSVGGAKGTYRIALGHNFENWTIKASQASGFKAASLYQSFSSFGNLRLNPETSLSRELGLTYSTIKTLFDVSLFSLNYENFIDYDSGTNGYLNLSSLENKGFEFNIEHHLGFVSLKGGYQYLLSRNPDTGALAPRRAKKRLSFSSTFYPIDNLNLTLAGQYVGERNETDGSRMPSFLLLNSSLQYSFNKNVIILSVNNLLDREYEELRNFGTPDRTFMISYSREIF